MPIKRRRVRKTLTMTINIKTALINVSLKIVHAVRRVFGNRHRHKRQQSHRQNAFHFGRKSRHRAFGRKLRRNINHERREREIKRRRRQKMKAPEQVHTGEKKPESKKDKVRRKSTYARCAQAIRRCSIRSRSFSASFSFLRIFCSSA